MVLPLLPASSDYLIGFVTDHVQLVRQHSLLFHYLSAFETDIKRKLAMELRRAEMLSPFIDSLGRTAYEKLHKELSYELGEVYLNIFELKLLKISEKNPQAAQTPEKFMKTADLNKCNEYCFSSIAMFQHFLSFYSKTEGTEDLFRQEKSYKSLNGDELIALPLRSPSWGMALFSLTLMLQQIFWLKKKFVRSSMLISLSHGCFRKSSQRPRILPTVAPSSWFPLSIATNGS